jgi:hypothetical protein
MKVVGCREPHIYSAFGVCNLSLTPTHFDMRHYRTPFSLPLPIVVIEAARGVRPGLKVHLLLSFSFVLGKIPQTAAHLL